MGVNTEKGFVEYRHIHAGVSGVPAVTVKLDVDQEVGSIKCSFAACSPNDNFSRSVGRSISDKRMEEGEFVEFPYIRNHTLIENVVAYLSTIMDEKIQPPESINVRELARIFYYIDFTLGVKDFREQVKNTEQLQSSESQLVLPESRIVGA